MQDKYWHDNCVTLTDELTSWPLQVCGDKPITRTSSIEFNGFFRETDAQRIILLFFYSLFLSLISFRYCDPIEIDTSVIKTF